MKVIAGCSASGTAPAARTGCRIPTPNRPEVCATSCPGCHAPELGEAFHEGAQGIVGDRQQHGEFGALDDVLDLQHRDAGEQGLGPFPAGVRDGGHADDGVLRAPQRRAQDGADLAGADDSDAEALLS